MSLDLRAQLSIMKCVYYGLNQNIKMRQSTLHYFQNEFYNFSVNFDFKQKQNDNIKHKK
jgi:hypothetical protein